MRTATTQLERADAWGLLSTPVVLEDLIWVYLAAGRDLDAEQTVRRLIRHRPDDATLFGALATILLKVGKSADAEQACRHALAQDPAYRRGREQLIEILKNQQRIDETAAQYRDAINLAPDDTAWRLGLAQLYVDARRPEDARGELELLLARVPESAQGHSMLGVCLLALGESDAGLSHLQRAVNLEPDSGKAQFNLGMAYLELRRIDEALPWLERAVQLNPDFAPGRYNLGVATYMTGRPREALHHIQEAIRLAPNDPDAQGFLQVLLDEIGRMEQSNLPSNEN